MAERRDPEALPRAFWSGTISFGLVSVPVDLFAAARSSRVSLRMLGPDGHPLARRYFCSADGEPLAADDIIRGYPRDGGYVEVSDEELEALAPRKSRDIDLRRFVDLDSIDPRMVERPYILAPASESTKAYHLLAETMERDRRAGIATFVMRGREYLAAIFAEGGLLKAVTMRFADELRTPAQIGLPALRRAPAGRRRAMAAALDALAADEIDESLLEDEIGAAMRELAADKRSRSRDVVEVPEEVAEPAEAGEVIDIMSVLAERLGAVGAQQTGERLSELSKKDLYERARELGIEGRSHMTKDQLIEAIRD